MLFIAVKSYLSVHNFCFSSRTQVLVYFTTYIDYGWDSEISAKFFHYIHLWTELILINFPWMLTIKRHKFYLKKPGSVWSRGVFASADSKQGGICPSLKFELVYVPDEKAVRGQTLTHPPALNLHLILIQKLLNRHYMFMVLFYALVLMLLDKFVPNSTIRRAAYSEPWGGKSFFDNLLLV